MHTFYCKSCWCFMETHTTEKPLRTWSLPKLKASWFAGSHYKPLVCPFWNYGLLAHVLTQTHIPRHKYMSASYRVVQFNQRPSAPVRQENYKSTVNLLKLLFVNNAFRSTIYMQRTRNGVGVHFGIYFRI